MEFIYTKNKHNSKINVWYNKIFIGQLDILLKENKDLDWKAIRVDKSIRVDVEDRWKKYYTISPIIRIFDSDQICGKYDSKEKAAKAILEHHHKMCKAELSTRSSAG
tara:strand:+ start:6496 stop:6816 length:321 start_codon:yes stop_codon:yes gene_type:complete